jgi:hypothetical protein
MPAFDGRPAARPVGPRRGATSGRPRRDVPGDACDFAAVRSRAAARATRMTSPLAGPAPLPGPELIVLRDVPLAIDPAEVRAFQGYKPLRPGPPGDTAAQLRAAQAAVAALMQPAVAYRVVPVAASGPDHLALADGQRLGIPAVGPHWGPVEAVAAVLVTIGAAVEEAVRERQAAGDVTAAWLDSAASAAVECLAEWANDELCRQGVAAGLRVTNRISPGLAGWPLAEQAVLLDLAGAAALGVRAGPGGGLVPAKTISCLVGLGRAARVDHYFVQCRRCWVPECPWRRGPAVAPVQRDL